MLSSYPDSAFQLIQQTLQLSARIEYARGQAEGHHLMGLIFYHQGFYSEALNHFQRAETLFQLEHSEKDMARNYNQLGLVYYMLRQPDVAFARHNEALKLYNKLQDISGIAYTYGCLGHYYEKKTDYKQALRYQDQALVYYKQMDDRNGMATILENIGSIHEDLEQYDSAEQYFRRSLSLNRETGDSILMITNLNNLGDVSRKRAHYPQALALSTQALQLALRLKDHYQTTSAYKDLSKAYSLSGDFKAAYNNLEKGRTLYEEIYGDETRRQAALLQTFFELERKTTAIQTLEKDQRIQSIITVALAIGLLLLTLLAIAIISRQRLKIRQDTEVIAYNESRQKLMQAELENAHLHEQQLQRELENKSKSLTAHTLHIISKNKMMEDIRTGLQSVVPDDPKEQRKKITGLIRLIDHNFVQDKDWDDFRHIFEQVHQHFFDRLQQTAQGLTSSDIRLAALIRLNLPSRDIATILGISPDSLRISRYRLRKKLKLEQGDSLTQYILQIV
jgi:tetratricopeptide (TPR) repeat protein